MAKAKAERTPPAGLEAGETYLFHTGRYDWLGRVLSVDGPYTVTLVDASLVMTTGRFHEFVRDGRAANMEIEPVPDGVPQGVQWLSWCWWPHPLLREQV
jgi:hypothetical protein